MTALSMSINIVAEIMLVWGWEVALFANWISFCSSWLQVSDVPIHLKRTWIQELWHKYLRERILGTTRMCCNTYRHWEELAGYVLSFFRCCLLSSPPSCCSHFILLTCVDLELRIPEITVVHVVDPTWREDWGNFKYLQRAKLIPSYPW